MTDRGGTKGFDGAKWIKGRKRHILVDVLGLLLAVMVTGADIQDRDGARMLLPMLRHRLTRLRLIWADRTSTGFFATWLYWLRPRPRIRLEIIKRSDQAQGFVLLPKRGVVERTFGWFGKYQHLLDNLRRKGLPLGLSIRADQSEFRQNIQPRTSRVLLTAG